MPSKIATSTPSSLKSGSQLGSYRIEALVGVGDDSEVYKAQHTVQNRTVAVKVLKPETGAKHSLDTFSQSAVKLSHPHLCAVQEIGKHEGTGFLPMEYLEGETLAARLKRGPLPLPEALKTALGIVDALENVHRAGLVHLAVNPSNVMLTPSGPKLLNLGWADRPKESATTAPAPAPAKPGDTSSASKAHSSEGLQYLSPEQLEGKPADARADLFSFGLLFYEMISGKKAFEGKTRAILVAAIDSTDPEPISTIQPSTPDVIDHVAARCLAKNPDERWQDAHALLVELKWLAESAINIDAEVVSGNQGKFVPVGIAVALLLLAAAVTLTVLYLRGPAEPETLQARIPYRGTSPADIAMSPDGKSIALVAKPDNDEPSSLFLRSVAAASFSRFGGTEDATQPFWSPNSQSIGFVAAGKLKTVAVAGGPPKFICDAPDFVGGTWNRDGTILFGSAKGLYRVSAQGGRPESITTVESSSVGHFWPRFLPDGRHYLYLAWSGEASSTVFAGLLESKERTRIMPGESAIGYSAPGYLVFGRSGTLYAQPFDAKQLALSGEPARVAEWLANSDASGRTSFDISQTGVLFYYYNLPTATSPMRAKWRIRI